MRFGSEASVDPVLLLLRVLPSRQGYQIGLSWGQSMKVGGRLSVLPCYVAHAQGARGLHLMVRDIIKAGHEECLVILQEYQALDRAL